MRPLSSGEPYVIAAVVGVVAHHPGEMDLAVGLAAQTVVGHRPDPGPVDMAKLIPLTLAVSAVLGLMSVLLIYADIVNPIVA